ncbi:MAG TPA: serine/threonine-protein kinase [Terriglobales bacterium]|nr:serine/threonine-protein kinase [Terriglobales bacterium]
MSWLSDRALDRLRAAADEPDLSGTRYRLVERLGAGGMGTVYLATDTALDRRIALKVLRLPDSSGGLAARLLREAKILAQLEHPGIVPVHDVGTLPDGRVFYTMKYVEGPRLDRWATGATSLPERLRIFERICDAAAFAHDRGVVHRDLKPENVMVGPFGEVLVMDWGVAKILSAVASRQALREAADAEAVTVAGPQLRTASAEQTGHGMVLGTPGYMAPEQARGESAQVDARADVFALGAILRFLLTGHAPPEATTLGTGGETARAPSASGSMPRALAAICAKAMAADPAARYPTAKELGAEVARYRDGLPVEAHRESLAERAARLFARHKVAILLVVAYLVMRVALIVWTRR